MAPSQKPSFDGGGPTVGRIKYKSNKKMLSNYWALELIEVIAGPFFKNYYVILKGPNKPIEH